MIFIGAEGPVVHSLNPFNPTATTGFDKTLLEEFHALIRDVKDEKKASEAFGSQLEGRTGVEQ